MDIKRTIAWFRHYSDTLDEQKSYLTKLDAAIGDGDHGANMGRGWRAVKEALLHFEGDIGQCFMLVSKILIAKVGGASGPLYGTIFLRMGMVLKGKETIEMKDWPQLLQAACAGIEQRGKVSGGEKTMYDVWQPLSAELELDQHDDEKALAAWLSETAETKAGATKTMKATKGRAAYLGERSIGHLDPGAVSTSLLFKSLHASLQED